MAYRKSYTKRGSYRATRKAAPRRKTTRRAPAPQIVKLVIEHTGMSTVARPEAAGMVEKRANKAKF